MCLRTAILFLSFSRVKFFTSWQQDQTGNHLPTFPFIRRKRIQFYSLYQKKKKKGGKKPQIRHCREMQRWKTEQGRYCPSCKLTKKGCICQLLWCKITKQKIWKELGKNTSFPSYRTSFPLSLINTFFLHSILLKVQSKMFSAGEAGDHFPLE